MKIEIINQQKIKRVNLTELERCIGYVLKALGRSKAEISVILCDNTFIKKINRRFFNKRSVTDVIAFGFDDKFNKNNLGEIIVSVEEALVQAPKYGNTFKKEFVLYVVHGILHLIGYDDLTEKKYKIMAAKQDELVGRIFKN
ncbi:MAG: rRNA maturation RNase YbeY [Candidatus Omnitrophica bacterium]|nr:rRNA maturation RNase YbeY [Candidatus Omnitrophota bacterium]MDD5441529.1 rRNA maturation RNase YbeY [Candidatus Omnitrophota bacterium]